MLLAAAAAVVMMCACSGERGYINYRCMSMGLPASKSVDSLQMKVPNLWLDTTKYEDHYVLADTVARNFTVAVYHQNDTITDILENYTATYNDSTSNLWQAMHDELEKEFKDTKSDLDDTFKEMKQDLDISAELKDAGKEWKASVNDVKNELKQAETAGKEGTGDIRGNHQTK